jgi:aspartyl-tRNA(Asn)/glutamyl-tRNA(Gln) amidotransferase subunit A
MTIKSFHEDLVSGVVSAKEALEAYLLIAEKENKNMNIYLETFNEQAMSEAEAIDARVAAGESPRALWGVPFAIKDNILIKGRHVSASSHILENYIASYDASVISKLKKEGAVFVGRTNMDEFAMGASTEHSAYGPTKNPHDFDRVPGGSSGGSAAAVSSGMAMAALGSDTGGSIRQPAAFCGVVGLKPTYGAVSRSGLIAMASSLDQIGPITQNVEDAETVFNAIRGRDPLDATTSTWSPGLQVEVGTPVVKTIGIPKEYFSDGLDPRIKNRIEEVINSLSKEFTIREISLPHTEFASACYYIIVPAEVSSNMARFDGIRYGVRESKESLEAIYKSSRGGGLGTEVSRRILLGTYVLSHGYYDAYYIRAQKVRAKVAHDFESAFGEVDIILSPTTPTLPFKLGERMSDPLAMYLADLYTLPANLAGIPGISIPIGFVEEDGKNLPIGMQLLAPHFAEDRLFHLGKIIETMI